MKTVDFKITSLTANYQYHSDILQKKGKNTQLGPVRKKQLFLLKQELWELKIF